MATAIALPRWDLTPFFPGIDSPEFEKAFDQIKSEIAGLENKFDAWQIKAAVKDPAASSKVEQILETLNPLTESLHLIYAYISGSVDVETTNDQAQAKSSELDLVTIDYSKLMDRFKAWVGAQDIDVIIGGSDVAKEHAHWLRRAQTSAKYQMSPVEEALASDLMASGEFAWSKLQSNLSSQITAVVKLPDGEKTLTMSQMRALAYEADRSVRKAGFEAELAAWKANEIPIAASLNGVKGMAGLLARRRGWGEPVNASLFSSSIDRQTLDAMLSAARDSFPDVRRYLKAKARKLGLEKLAFYDIFAPIKTEGGKTWSYDEAQSFIEKQFDTFAPQMGDLARRSARENWVDAEPRKGKVDGAYCAGFGGNTSRILMNYKESFGSVSTLAHELGHAYHNWCLGSKVGLLHNSPMTLAETASIFCETVIKRAGLREADEAGQLAILEASLQGCCQVTVDITSRYLFETAVFERRAERDLSPTEFCEIMTQAQRDTYGDGLDQDTLHPYMWAAKPHYYSAGMYFYNYPYMFGLLFALGLYQVYRAEPNGFVERYDRLLASTAMADAATLANEFGIDIRTPEFWRGSMRQIVEDIELFEKLAG